MSDSVRSGDDNAFLRQFFFILVLIAIGVVIFSELRFFLSSFLGATAIYVVARRPLFWAIEKKGIKKWIASLGLVLLTVLAISLGGYLTIKLLAPEIAGLDTSRIMAGFDKFTGAINSAAGFNVVPDDVIMRSGSYITQMLESLLSATYSVVVNVILMLVTLFFMAAGGRKMECFLCQYAPFKGRSLQLLRREIKDIIFSNAVGIPLVMIAQSITAALIYWLLGINNVFFWAFVTAICGLVPLIGTGLVYIPLSLYFFADGDAMGGLALLIYGAVVIGNIDSVVRIYLMKKVADTHPLIVVFGVLLGIPLFGFWGIIFGPLLVSGFILLVRIYYVEYGLITEEQEAEKIIATPSTPEGHVPRKHYHFYPAVSLLRRLKGRGESDNK